MGQSQSDIRAVESARGTSREVATESSSSNSPERQPPSSDTAATTTVAAPSGGDVECQQAASVVVVTVEEGNEPKESCQQEPEQKRVSQAAASPTVNRSAPVTAVERFRRNEQDDVQPSSAPKRSASFSSPTSKQQHQQQKQQQQQQHSRSSPNLEVPARKPAVPRQKTVRKPAPVAAVEDAQVVQEPPPRKPAVPRQTIRRKHSLPPHHHQHHHHRITTASPSSPTLPASSATNTATAAIGTVVTPRPWSTHTDSSNADLFPAAHRLETLTEQQIPHRTLIDDQQEASIAAAAVGHTWQARLCDAARRILQAELELLHQQQGPTTTSSSSSSDSSGTDREPLPLDRRQESEESLQRRPHGAETELESFESSTVNASRNHCGSASSPALPATVVEEHLAASLQLVSQREQLAKQIVQQEKQEQCYRHYVRQQQKQQQQQQSNGVMRTKHKKKSDQQLATTSTESAVPGKQKPKQYKPKETAVGILHRLKSMTNQEFMFGSSSPPPAVIPHSTSQILVQADSDEFPLPLSPSSEFNSIGSMPIRASEYRPHRGKVQPLSTSGAGGLGPDLQNDEYLEKKHRSDKARRFAQAVRHEHSHEVPTHPAAPKWMQRDERKEFDRGRALHYAAQVQPPARHQKKVLPSKHETIDADAKEELSMLEKLEANHAELVKAVNSFTYMAKPKRN